MNSPDPALVDYIQRRIQRTRHRDAERHTLARREAARIRANAYDRLPPVLAAGPCYHCGRLDVHATDCPYNWRHAPLEPDR